MDGTKIKGNETLILVPFCKVEIETSRKKHEMDLGLADKISSYYNYNDKWKDLIKNNRLDLSEKRSQFRLTIRQKVVVSYMIWATHRFIKNRMEMISCH